MNLFMMQLEKRKTNTEKHNFSRIIAIEKDNKSSFKCFHGFVAQVFRAIFYEQKLSYRVIFNKVSYNFL